MLKPEADRFDGLRFAFDPAQVAQKAPGRIWVDHEEAAAVPVQPPAVDPAPQGRGQIVAAFTGNAGGPLRLLDRAQTFGGVTESPAEHRR